MREVRSGAIIGAEQKMKILVMGMSSLLFGAALLQRQTTSQPADNPPAEAVATAESHEAERVAAASVEDAGIR